MMRRWMWTVLCLFMGLSTGLSSTSPVEYFKGSPVVHATSREFNNPASLVTSDPNGSWYRYGLTNISGSIHHPFEPDAATFHTITAAGYKALKDGTLFSGTFSYRENREYDRLFRHNSTLNAGIPIYLADSTTGDWHMSGIQWTLDIQKPLSESLSGGLGLTYLVDEQIKQNFPKPGVKRNGYELISGLYYHSEKQALSLAASLFEFKEEIETVKYSLEQNLTPVFMLYRGFSQPVFYRGQTSYERLQTRQGFSLSAGMKTTLPAESSLKGEVSAEWSQGEAEDEGTDAIPQGSWTTRRINWDFAVQMHQSSFVSPVLSAEGHTVMSEATHPDFPLTLYEGNLTEVTAFAGINLGYTSFLTAGVNLEGFETWREDSFHGRGLYGKQLMMGPKLQVQKDPASGLVSCFYVAALKEVSGESRLEQKFYSIPPAFLEDEAWAMTAGNTLVKAGSSVETNILPRFSVRLDASYAWLADWDDHHTIHARRDQFLVKMTLIPKYE